MTIARSMVCLFVVLACTLALAGPVVERETGAEAILPEAAERLERLNAEALAYQQKAQYDLALALVDSALALAHELEDEAGAMRAYNTGAIAYLRMGRLTEALEWQTATMRIAEAIGDTMQLGIAHNNLGAIIRMQGDYALALEHHVRAQAITSELGDSANLSAAIVNIGHVYYFMNDMDAALAAYTKAYPLCEALDDHKCVMVLEVSRGNIHLAAERYPEALAHYNKALEVEALVGNRSLAADILNNIGLAHHGAGDLPNAIKAHTGSLKVKTEVGDLSGMGNSHKNLGVLHAAMGNADKAVEHFHEGLRIAREVGSKYLLAGLHEELSAVETGRGRYRSALDHFKLYVLYKDSMHNESTTQRIEEMKIAMETKEREAALEILERDHALVRAELDAHRSTQRYQAIGFSLMLLLGGGASGFLVYRRRQSLLVKNTRMELALVKAQMKPHFVFNALTSAHAALAKVDQRAADHLLSLAKHMRSVLNSSMKDEVDLAVEMRHWEEYLTLEKLALAGGFEHRIHIAPDLDPHDVRVPSMLLQPILENAVCHGVAHRAEGRLVQVHVERADDLLRIHVSDNGPGNGTVKREEHSRHPGTPGVGLQLIRDRIRIHYGADHAQSGVSVEHGPDGTAVQLMLPLQRWDE